MNSNIIHQVFSNSTYYLNLIKNETTFYNVFLQGSPTLYFANCLNTTNCFYNIIIDFFEKYTNCALTLNFTPPSSSKNIKIIYDTGVLSGHSVTLSKEQLNIINKISISIHITTSDVYIIINTNQIVINTPSSSGKAYKVFLNGCWELSPLPYPEFDYIAYDGIYRSFKNKGVHSSEDVMTILIQGYSTFTLYIRSYAESSFDYVMVGNLDKIITKNSSCTDTTMVKAHTQANQQSGTHLSSYTKVQFTNIDKGIHFINILYRKDSSANSGDDRGYLVIPRNQ